MENYKPFRKQFIECKESGNLIEIDISSYRTFPKTALVCLKYKSVCHSGVCRNERISEKNEDVDLTN